MRDPLTTPPTRPYPSRTGIVREPPPRDFAAEIDEGGVRSIAHAMSAKLATKRAQGYGGWNDPALCPVERLAQMLIDHLAKGDPVDVANFAMMLHNRTGGAQALKAAALAAGLEVPG